MEHAEKVSDVTNFMYISPIVAAIVYILLGKGPHGALYGEVCRFGDPLFLIDIDGEVFLLVSDRFSLDVKNIN